MNNTTYWPLVVAAILFQKYAKCGDCTSQSERFGLDACEWCVSDGRCHSSTDILVKRYFCASPGWVEGDKCPSTPLPSLSAIGCNGQVRLLSHY